MSFPSTLTATDVAQKGWEAAQMLKRSQHNPLNKTAQLDAIADRAVVLQDVAPNATLTVTDAAAGTLPLFFAGELTTALARAPIVGDRFQVNGAGDTTDNRLQTAKTVAVVAGDVFTVTNVTATTEAVTYDGLRATQAGVIVAFRDSATPAAAQSAIAAFA